MSRTRVAFAASDLVAREAAEKAALSGASALGCVIWAYLTVGAAQPGVLLSPMSILVTSFGARRVFDGRVRQPGIGATRPRGFREGDEIPDAARIGAPASLSAAFVALGYDDPSLRSSALRAAIAVAKGADAPARASLFEQARGSGGAAFKDSEVSRALLMLASPAQGGMLTRDDFDQVSALDLPAEVGDALVSQGFPDPTPHRDLEPQAIVALDRRGSAAVLCYAKAVAGAPILDGELLAPRIAVPVLRGVTRVRPGTPLSPAGGASIELDPSGVPLFANSSFPTLRVGAPS